MRPARDQTGTGCGGDLHPAEDCPRCRRRSGDLPSWPEFRPVGGLEVMAMPGGVRFVESLVGFALAGVALPLWRITEQGWKAFAVAAGLVGLGLLYHSLFTRDAIVIDPRNRLFVESQRALLRPRQDLARSFAEIAFIGVEHFHERTFEDGHLKEQALRANVWIEWIEGGCRSFGSDSPREAASFADELHRLTDAPLRTTLAQQSPTQDHWTVSSSD